MTTNKSKREADLDLTKALDQTFPASDPVASNEVDEKAVRPIGRRPPLIDEALVDRLAEQVAKDHPTKPAE